MKQERQVTGIREKLRNGVEIKNKSPNYFNAVVGHGYVGYDITLTNADNKHINLVLKVLNSKELFNQPSITMTIHSIFHYSSGGKEELIESDMIGSEVILTSNSSGRKVINDYYTITGILTLKNEPH